MRWVWLALFLAFGTLGVEGTDARAGSRACTLATKGDSPVAKACASPRGFAAAKSLMRDMVKKANKDGKSKEELKCETCHQGIDDDRYDVLTKNGRELFKDLLARAGDVAAK
jgi:hypothetical protein